VKAVESPSRQRGTEHELPGQLTTLIGREGDLKAVAASLSSARLLTLTGAGGVGKTRLAVEAAARGVAGFPDGVWWIALAGLDDAGAVASTLVQTLGLRSFPGLGELDVAVAFLRERRALLVIDNCEHLAEEVARVSSALLRACPSLSVFATSRVPLAIPGEMCWEVPPLALPSEDGVAGLHGSAAARLLI
jgi:predicted ATPase